MTTPRMLGPFDETVAIDVKPIHDAEARDLRARFGVIAWFGFYTRHWWALTDRALVEAPNPIGLAEAIVAARRRPA
ncbi:hypothetical protein [Actinomadura fibrosa]|uniref:Uncharacterized protein n=1 Tax=Actinomadura fibrosa TaxID=111802 RepID=A0ABW2XN88_9ACTN|nr:hypothetical protein [Actinomadura fibrosa]